MTTKSEDVKSLLSLSLSLSTFLVWIIMHEVDSKGVMLDGCNYSLDIMTSLIGSRLVMLL